MTKIEKLFRVKKIAEILAVSPKTIRKWAKDKILPGIKIGPRGDWRFTKNDLSKIMKGKGGEKL